MSQVIVTHISPDFDAIGSCWLLKRFLLPEAEIVLTNTGNPDQALLTSATAVADTGRIFHPLTLRFDHHQLDGQAANATCATLQVFNAIGGGKAYLAPIVDLIYAGDTGKPEANLSRSVGIHALLSIRKARRDTDQNLLEWGFGVLDDLASGLKAKQEARLSLAQHTVYKSADGLVWALDGAPQGATFAAFEEGARLVVFHSEAPGTVSVGAMRGGESQEPSIRDLVLSALTGNLPEALEDELRRWFLHPAGFFGGRGTAKAPDPTPLTVSVAAIAAALDEEWVR
jgi:hypothetical protein